MYPDLPVFFSTGHVTVCWCGSTWHYPCKYLDLSASLALRKPLSAGVVFFVHLQCVYVFCYVFSDSNKVVQTAVIYGVG